MEKSNIYQIRVKARIYAGEKFIYTATFPVYVEAADEKSGRVAAAEIMQNLRVEGAMALNSYGNAETQIPLEAVGIRYPVEKNPEFGYRGVIFQKDAVTSVAVYGMDGKANTVIINFTRNGKKDFASFGGYPCSKAEWEASINSLLSTIGIQR